MKATHSLLLSTKASTSGIDQRFSYWQDPLFYEKSNQLDLSFQKAAQLESWKAYKETNPFRHPCKELVVQNAYILCLASGGLFDDWDNPSF